MKKLFFKSMMVLALASSFVACSEEDDDNNGGNVSIVGTWDVNSESYTLAVTGQPNESDTMTYANGEFVIVFNNNSQVITTSVDSSGTSVDTGNYSLNGSVLSIFTEDAGSRDTTIFNANVTSNKLVLSQSESEVIGGVTYAYTYKINCTKR